MLSKSESVLMYSSSEHLPRLVFIGDVPIESSHHGSALLYRLLEDYPPEKLVIIESNLAPSLPNRRLPHVVYHTLRIGYKRLLNSRLHGLYTAWLSWTATSRGARVISLLDDFAPDAVISVGHGFGWLTAAKVAGDLRMPFHLIVHDDWPRLSGVTGQCRDWLEALFAQVYCDAASRLCVSPYMVEEYFRRYGARGSVLYPSRSTECPVFEPVLGRVFTPEDEMVIGYGGNGCPEVVSCLRILASVLAAAKARLFIYGPFANTVKQELLAISSSITFHGMVPYKDMILGLHATADILFVPMSFGDESRDNMIVSFPSKLADYTATGRPLLIYGPSFCSAVRWAKSHFEVAEVVEEADSAQLLASLIRLRNNPTHSSVLARRAGEVGKQNFSASTARTNLHKVLTAGATASNI
jgi:hypothetical protein